MNTNDLDPKDFKYVIQTPDKSFSPTRNKAVINETIKSTEAYFRGLQEVVDKGLGERIDAVSSYGCYRFNRGSAQIKDYLGKRLYTQLVGEHILEKVRVMKSVNKLNGNDKFMNSILL